MATAVNKYQFLDEAGIQILVKEIMARTDIKIQTSIVDKVDEKSDNKHSVGAKKFYDTIQELKNSAAGGANVIIHTGALTDIEKPLKDVVYFQRDNEDSTSWNICIYTTYNKVTYEEDPENERPKRKVEEVTEWIKGSMGAGLDISKLWSKEELQPMIGDTISEKIDEIIADMGSLNIYGSQDAPGAYDVDAVVKFRGTRAFGEADSETPKVPTPPKGEYVIAEVNEGAKHKFKLVPKSITEGGDETLANGFYVDKEAIIGKRTTNVDIYATEFHEKVKEVEAKLADKADKSQLENLVNREALDLKADKTQLENLATKTELEPLATKVELQTLATKDELQTLATKAELQTLASKDEVGLKADKTYVDEELAKKVDKTAAEEDKQKIQQLEEKVTQLTNLLEEMKNEYYTKEEMNILLEGKQDKANV